MHGRTIIAYRKNSRLIPTRVPIKQIQAIGQFELGSIVEFFDDRYTPDPVRE
jgi:hypothetical protein